MNQRPLTQQQKNRYFGKDMKNYLHDKTNIFNDQFTTRGEIAHEMIITRQSLQGKHAKLNLFKHQSQTFEDKENSNLKIKPKKMKINVESFHPLNQNFFSNLNLQTNTNKIEEELPLVVEKKFFPLDQFALGNPQQIAHYTQEIFTYLKQQEIKFTLTEQYMTPILQPDINAKMRSILIDWLVDVHLKFKLKTETLYVCINLIDRYLSKNPTTRSKLQLVGVSSLFIACKYEEIYPPDLKDFVYITDNAYTKDEVLEMEGRILFSLNFDITQPSIYCFLQRYSNIAGLDEKNTFLAQYLIELSLIEHRFVVYRPSHLASAAIYLVHKIRKDIEPWSDFIKQITQFSEEDLRPCAKEMCILLQQSEKASLQAVRKKFSCSKFMEVSKVKVEKQSKAQS